VGVVVVVVVVVEERGEKQHSIKLSIGCFETR
jgi:hypothetical protein